VKTKNDAAYINTGVGEHASGGDSEVVRRHAQELVPLAPDLILASTLAMAVALGFLLGAVWAR
jgi:hypothetical protein